MLLRTDAAGPWETRHDAEDPPTNAWEQRIDRGAVLSSVRRDDGTLLVEGVAAKAGIYQYRRADGSMRRELVTAEMLDRTAPGLGRAPVTLHHPDPKKHPKGVTPDNVQELVVGDTDGNVRLAEGGFVRVFSAVRRRDALDAIANGTQELSPGYAVQLGPGGTHPVYGAYDAEQVDRRYNHLAIVDAARGGADVRLHLDDATAICTETFTGATPSAGSPAPTPNPTHHDGGSVRIVLLEIARHLGLGDQRFDTDESLAKAISVAVQQRNDADEAAAAELQRMKDEAAAHTAALKAEKDRADQEKTRADAAELAAKNLKEAEQLRADKAEREELEALAVELHLDAAQHPLLKDLRRAIASTELGEQVKADATDDYVAGLLTLARKRAKERADGRKAGERAWAPPTMRGTAGPQGTRGRVDTNGGVGGQSPTHTPAHIPTAPSGRPGGFARVRARQDSLRNDAKTRGGE